MTLRTYVVELVQKHDDDLGNYMESARVDGIQPTSYPRLTVVSYDLDDEQHERLLQMPHTTLLGPTSDQPSLDDPWPSA